MAQRVVILGGGMGALSTAWQLTRQPDWRTRFSSVHVYQMGWRLGGKCATGRGPMRRVQEHGIHLFGGGYYNALGMMQQVYAELAPGPDGQHTPFTLGFEPQYTSVRVQGERKLVVRFPPNRRTLADAARLASPGGWHAWLGAALEGLRVYLVPLPAALLWAHTDPLGLPRFDPAEAGARYDALAALLGAPAPPDPAHTGALLDGLQAGSDQLWAVAAALPDTPATAPVRALVLLWSTALNYAVAVARAWLAFVAGGAPLATLDAENYDTCLARHGARPATLGSVLALAPLRILYQFEHGDPARPRLGAGCYLHWVLRSFAYVEAPFWFFTEGTGESLVRPLYQLLVQRGVQFHFFHKVESLSLDPTGSHVARVRLRVQARTADGSPYQPLDQGCWPDRPLHGQLADGDEVAALPAEALESYWSDYHAHDTTELALSPIDDAVVLAIPVPALPHIAPDLLHRPDWAAMVRGLGTVETQSLQLWLDRDSHSLGVNLRATRPIAPDDTGLGAGFAQPYDTFADFSPLIRHEDWRGAEVPKALWYFSDVMATPPGGPDLADPQYPLRRLAEARRQARRFVATDLARLLPLGRGTPPQTGFDERHLVVPDPARATQPGSRLDQQYLRANIQPTDRYVQALPGTTGLRLDAGRAPGVHNLVLAGDWTCNGLNVGCVEAAVMSGLLAGNALLQTADPRAGVVGCFPR